jgi:phenylalanine-4-hydroxylase
MNTKNGLRIYGAGIISSFGESKSSLSDDVEVKPFDLDKVLNQEFRTDVPQNLYFEINDLNDLYDSIIKLKKENYAMVNV